MPIKTESSIITVGSQRDNRYPDTFFDQHRHASFPDGRPWNGLRELSANKGEKDGFCSALMPGDHNDMTAVWNAPWLPEHRFFKFNYTRNKISIDYAAMMAHDQQYTDLYYEAASVISMEKGLPPVKDGALPPYMIRQILKTPPRSPKIAAACLAGDPWILGFSQEPNTVLQGLLAQLTLNFRDAASATITATDVVSVTPNELKDMIAQAVEVAMQAKAKRQDASPLTKTDKSEKSKPLAGAAA